MSNTRRSSAVDPARELSSLLRRASRIEAASSRAASAAKKHDEDEPGPAGTAADRLKQSVIRPLRDALEHLARDQDRHKTRVVRAEGGQANAADGPASTSEALGEPLWQLARDVTQLRCFPGIGTEVQEAAAALQDLVCQLTPDDKTRALRIAELREIQVDLARAIQSQKNGPYLVTNVENLTNWLGERLPARPQMALCRCGASHSKPFCDGTHAEIGFKSKKDPKRVPDRLDTYTGQQVTILDNRGTCQHSGFCTDRLASAFRVDVEPFVAPSGGRMDEIIRAVRDCPSGALSFAIDGVEAREEVDYHGRREPTIEVSKDGPYRVTGAIRLTDAQDKNEPRNDGASCEHYALCRCGQSQNKPFCSGRHWYVGFADPPRGAEPNLFQWAGGVPALTRFARFLFEKHVPDDVTLAPLFADMPSDLVDREAAWLTRAFGGSSRDTTPDDDADPVAASVAGKGLTDAQRRRWVELTERSADEAGLPTDAEFRAAFAAYQEWRSRALLEQPPADGTPPTRAAAVRWDWTPAGGPPLSEPSGQDAGTDASVTLPGADEPVTFVEHIKGLFRPSDLEAMKWAFDLASYGDVASNAPAILQRLTAGSMPCDGAWPAEKIAVFQRWVDAGTPESATGMTAPPARGEAPAPTEPAESIGGRLANLIKLRSDIPVGDRPLVIEHREPLIYMLCSAAELEHALMCEYLFAAFTLKRSTDEALSDDQLAAVERWRSAILTVAKQEMLHLAINCNLVNSLGASPHLSRPNLPQPAKHYPGGVRLTLLPFGEEALRHFLYLERPEGMNFDDAEGVAAVERAVPVMGKQEIAPHLQEFATVGHLYRSIEAGFRHLADKIGQDNLFVGHASGQATGDLFGWPQLQAITSVDDAVRAIETIVEQGEGPRGDWRNAHFGRFLAVLDEYLAMIAANPGVEVARPVLPALVRPPEDGDAADLITDPRTAAIADLGNVAYEVLLQLLYRLLSRVDETEDQMKILAQIGVGLMFDVVEPLGEVLTTLPVGPEHPGRTAGPSFELFYQPDYLLPHREAAWLLMSEHLADAADLTQAQGASEPRLLPVAEALRRHAYSLRTHSR